MSRKNKSTGNKKCKVCKKTEMETYFYLKNIHICKDCKRSKIPKRNRKMSESKRQKLIDHVFNYMSRKDKGRAKGPAMTNNYGVVIKRRR